MPTNFWSLPTELRFEVYRLYEAAWPYEHHTPAVIGDRLLLPPLLYACREADMEVGGMIFAKLEDRFFQTKKLRAVVIDLDFSFLLDYIDNLEKSAPMLSGKGFIHVVLAFTKRCLSMDTITTRARKLDLWAWQDVLCDLELYWDRPITETFEMVFETPKIEAAFKESPFLNAMAACKYESEDLSVIRIAKAEAAKERVNGLNGWGDSAANDS